MTTQPNQLDKRLGELNQSADENLIQIKSLADRAIQVFGKGELTVASFIAAEAHREL